jgi:two-component system, NtrC family, sensor kinase
MWRLKAALTWHKKKRKIGVQSKFLFGLALIFFGFCLVATTLLYLFEKKTLEENALQKTESIMAVVESTKDYVKDMLRPRMYELYGKDTFVLEAMSTSYVSRVVMNMFQENMPDFEYRRVSINAFNPDYEATSQELEMIRYFKDNPYVSDWTGITRKGSKHVYTHFRPVIYSDSCMHCHGKPADAPPSIVSLYGNSKGFNQPLNQIGGIVSVSVPVDVGTVAILGVAWKVFCVTLCAFFMLYGIIWLFFNNLIIRDLHEILDVFRDTLRDEDGLQLYEKARSMDEFGELSIAVQQMAEHLRINQQTLEDYAQNLEKKVTERTLALEDSKRVLHEQYQARVKQLGVMNTIAELITQSADLDEILPRILKLALRVVPAAGAGIYLLDRKKSMLVLQCQSNTDGLESEIHFDADRLAMLDQEQMDFDGFIREAVCEYYRAIEKEPLLAQNVNVPLCCRQSVLGVISFVGNREGDWDIQMQELIFSIAHHIGITIESLQNMTALIHSKELLQTVFDGITDLVILLDHKQRIKMVNQAFLRRHEVSMAAILDRPLSSMTMKIPCPFSFCNLAISFTHRGSFREQVQVEGAAYEVSFYPIVLENDDSSGRVRNIVCYAKDITKQREIEQRIQQTEKLVALGQLAAGVAHEINNPLGVILCYTDILLKTDKESDFEQHHKDIHIIKKHARSCQRIVSDLLNFSHSRRTVRQKTELNPIVDEVISMVTPEFHKKKMTLEKNLSADVPQLQLDPGQIKQVFLNLLMNALYAGYEKGRVEITSRLIEQGRQVAVEFFDNGQGIEPQVIDKIFDPFFTTKPQGMGTGLGLSVSYGIVQEHHGDIRVKSKPGEWTRFTLILPVSDPINSDAEGNIPTIVLPTSSNS